MDWTTNLGCIFIFLHIFVQDTVSWDNVTMTPLATGVNYTLNVAASFTNNTDIPLCSYSWGDGTTESTQLDSPTTPTDINRLYESFGEFDIEIFCITGGQIYKNSWTDFYVGDSITNVTIGGIPEDLIMRLNASLETDINIDVQLGTGTNVTIVATLLNNNESYTVTNALEGSNNVSLSRTDFTSNGVFTITINASNPLNSLSKELVLAIQQPVVVSGISFTGGYDTDSPTSILVNHEFNIETTFVSGDDVTVTATVFDSNQDRVDIVGTHCTGIVSIMNVPFLFQNTGSYTIEIEAANYFNSHNQSITVNVKYDVNAFSASMTSTVSLYTESLVFQIAIGDDTSVLVPQGNVICTFVYGDNTTDETVMFDLTGSTYTASSIPPQLHSYIAGLYTSRIICANELPNIIDNSTETTYTKTFEIIVLNPVEGLTMVTNSNDTNYHPFSKDILFTISLSNPAAKPLVNITCVFSFTGPENTNEAVTGNATDSSTITYIKKFSTSGNHLLSVNCSNALTFQSPLLTQEITVYYDCWKTTKFFDVTYQNETNPIQSGSNNDVQVKGVVELQSYCELPVVNTWTLQKDGETTKSPICAAASSCILEKYTQDEGLYRLELCVTFINLQPNAKLCDYVYIKYTIPDLVAILTDGLIVRGTIVEFLRTSPFLIDSSESHDPAYPPGSLQSQSNDISRLWDCKTGPNLSKDDVSLFFLTNDMPSTATNDCSHHFPVSNLEKKYNFLPDTFDVDKFFIFTLNYTRNQRYVTKSIAVKPVNLPTLTLELQCIQPNCYDTNSNMKKLIMSAYQANVAIIDVNNISAVYKWTVQRLLKSNELQDITDQISGIRNTSGIMIPEAVFRQYETITEGAKYQISCEVTVEGYAKTEIVQPFKMNLPPYDGDCKLTIPSGDVIVQAGVTEVCVECKGIVDEGRMETERSSDDFGGSLVYLFSQSFLDANNETSGTKPDVIYNYDEKSTSCFVLAKPDLNINPFARINVKVSDKVLLSPFLLFTFMVKVYPPFPSNVNGSGGAKTVNGVAETQLGAIKTLNGSGAPDKVVSRVAILSSLMDPEVDEPDPVFALEYGDKRPDGSFVSADEATADLSEPFEDPVITTIKSINTQAAHVLKDAQNQNSKLVKDGDKALSSESLQGLAAAVSVMCTNPPQFVNKTVLSIVNDVASQMNRDIEQIVNGTIDPVVLDMIGDTASMMASTMAVGKPTDTEKELGIYDGKEARQYAADMEAFETSEEIKDRENRDMSVDEKTFFTLHGNKKLTDKIKERQKVVRDSCDNFAKLIGTTTNLKASNGAVTKIGNEDNSTAAITVMDNEARQLAKTPINSKSTSVLIPGLADMGQNKVSIALGEASGVVPLDEGAETISSSYKVLHINTHGDAKLPNTKIKITHKITPPAYTTVTADVKPEDASGFSSYHNVYVKSADDMLCTTLKPSPSILKTVAWITYYGSVSKNNFVAKEERTGNESHTVCFLPVQRGAGRETGVWKVAFELELRAVSTETGRKRRSATNNTDVTYDIAFATMGCKLWDPNANAWKSDRCDGEWKPDSDELICDCLPQKEMTFANSFYVPPNAIDFSSVFLKFSPLNQAAVMGTLILIFLIYAIVILWARRQDKKDLLKWGITPLADNFAEDNYFYVIKVHTGIRPGSGTKSTVGFVIAGDDMDTGVRELADGVRKEFSTGSVMNFLMSTNMHLGDLEYMRLWHDNSGGGNNASWYLSKIEIQDIQRNEMFVFMAERWLAVEKGDGSVECVVPVSKTENYNVFKNRFYVNAKDNLAESHIWISVVYRPQTSNFTRVQRASCALVFIMLTMISNAMFFESSDTENYETPSEVQVGPFRFSLRQIYISLICALITTPATLVVIYLFKMSRSKPATAKKVFQIPKKANRYKVPFMGSWLEKEQQRSMELEKHLIQAGYPKFQGFYLPHWVINIAWLLVILATFCSAFFIMLYSMEWGKQKSEEWLTTFFLSFFESVFCLDPVKIAIMALVFAILFRSTRDSTALINRSTVMKKYSSSLRGKSGCIRLPAPPLDKEKLTLARDIRARELLMRTALKDLIANIVIIWILFSISYSNRDAMSYYMHNEVVGTLLEPVNVNQPKFSQIKTTNDYFNWLNNTVIINMFPENDVNGDRLQWRQRQFTTGGAKLRVGPPRLRQVRVSKETCKIPYMKTRNCFKEYNEPTEETSNYCLQWSTPTCNSKQKLYNLSAPAWEFTSALDIWGMPISGLYTTYGGGGYIAKLSVNRQVSQLILDELYLNSWIDRQTRSVVFEFTLYCLNANIFTYNMFMVEFPETGGAFPFHFILPLRVYQHIGSLGYYTLACEILFALYVLICTILTIIEIYRQKKSYFKGWRLYDFLFLLLCYVAIIMYIGRLLMTDKAMQVFKEDKKEFVNFYHIALWDLMLVLLLGILVFLATLRLLNILGYNKRIGAVARVFTSAASELIWFGIFFLSVFTCYAVFGYLLFGSTLKSYKNIYKTMGTLFISMIGKSRFTEMEATNPVMSKIYFMIFIFFVVYMILTMFLAVLSKSIDQVHQDSKRNKGDEMVDYLLKKFKDMLSYRGGSGSNNRSAVKPAPPPSVFGKNRPTKIYEIDNRQILEDIRKTIHDAMVGNRADFTTPTGEHHSKVRFRH